MTTNRSLTFSARLTGSVNYQDIELSGKGRIERGLGLTDGTYDLVSLPSGFDPHLLSAFLITGYPNATASIDDAPNLFRDHSYEYRRILHFRDGGKLSFRASCMLVGEHITSKFHLRGHATVPKLVSVEPIVESWEPDGPGGIRGHFTISWRKSDGKLITADADTTYQILDVDGKQDGMLHRFIRMKTFANGNTLRKIQTVGLFRELPKSLWIADQKAVLELEQQMK